MDSDKTAPSSEKKEQKKSGKKIFIWIFVIIFAGIITMLGIATWITAALFEPEPFTIVNKTPDPEHLQNVMKKFGLVLDDKNDDKNNMTAQILAMLTQNSKTVELTKDEVNALLDTSIVAGRVYLEQKFPDLTISDLRFEDGVLKADASLKNKFSTPFGKYFNMKITLLPSIINNHLSMKVKHLSVGSMVISGSYLQKYIDSDIDDFEKTDDGEAVLDIITEFSLKKDKITLTFNPQQMTVFAAQKMSENSGLLNME